jgi:hypothetical protein
MTEMARQVRRWIPNPVHVGALPTLRASFIFLLLLLLQLLLSNRVRVRVRGVGARVELANSYAGTLL